MLSSAVTSEASPSMLSTRSCLRFCASTHGLAYDTSIERLYSKRSGVLVVAAEAGGGGVADNEGWVAEKDESWAGATVYDGADVLDMRPTAL